ncbi:hypothetical protein ACFSC3_12990 [Sphingomonas floccifaciens]|uniref:Uncharacterized protein n=1 Tax=Sphingomonas floccifaciens TaxID=1844115 RepID=A0ABW4NEK9_9SPHN|nr:hypothetical protein [Roseomonas aeriglobus]
MTNDNRTRRVAEAHAIGAILALVRAAGWTVEKDATTALPLDFWNYLYVPEASLLLVPAIEDPRTMRGSVAAGVCAARSDALVVSLGQGVDGIRQMSVSICQWSMLGTHWHGPHLPWLAADGAVWVVPDHRAPVDAQPSFRLGDDALDLRSAPFTNQIDHRRGLIAARDLIDQALEG